MGRATVTTLTGSTPNAQAYVELLKPITWFPPMWAYGCGIVAAGVPLQSRWPLAIAGVALAGPLVCGTSQVVNDWFDRDVDAINEPNRPIPSGRVPGRQGLWFAIAWTVLSLGVAMLLGPWVVAAAVVGLALAWAYSAPPFRLKQNGWWGNAAVGLCYEGLPWFTAAAAMSAGLPAGESIVLALLYSIGAHGIMTLNDFKSIRGDTIMSVRSLPVQLGAARAARVACLFMAVPQLAVIALLVYWQQYPHAGIVTALLAVQFVLMRRFLADPQERAQWYSATAVNFFVLGMLASAFAARNLLA